MEEIQPIRPKSAYLQRSIVINRTGNETSRINDSEERKKRYLHYLSEKLDETIEVKKEVIEYKREEKKTIIEKRETIEKEQTETKEKKRIRKVNGWIPKAKIKSTKRKKEKKEILLTPYDIEEEMEEKSIIPEKEEKLSEQIGGTKRVVSSNRSSDRVEKIMNELYEWRKREQHRGIDSVFTGWQ